jgi:hypothetical protein
MRVPQVYKFGKKLESYVLEHLPKESKQGAYVIVAFADPVAQGATENQS